MSTSAQVPSPAKNQQDNNSSVSTVPQLDHDSSALPTNSPPNTFQDSSLNGHTSLNPEAPWFGFDGSLLVDGPFHGNSLPSYDQCTFQAGLTSNDDLRWMLMGLSARIATLEQSVAAGRRATEQLSSNFCGILGRLAAIEGMLKIVEDLKNNLRDFTRGLMPHIFGEHIEEDLEKQDHCTTK